MGNRHSEILLRDVEVTKFRLGALNVDIVSSAHCDIGLDLQEFNVYLSEESYR